MKPIFVAILLSFVAITTSDDYDTWHQHRIESLKSEDGWLNLAGLFWLNEGDNSFGSAASNALVFPEKSPKKLGVLTLKGGKVSLKTQKGVDIELKNAPTTPEYVFENGKAITMQHGALRWFIIKRGPKYGVRLRDLANPVVAQFKGVERFAVREDWKITATFEAPQTPKTIAITDVIGLTSQQPLLGHAVFTINQKTYRLAATDAGDGKLFLIFKDKTAGVETYGAGRFLYADKPDETGKVTLDFNKAINPPCAFSTYATCPLPPAENNLPIRVEAGEKNAGMH
ncbi:MAG: DUF1684 domain-containing protein [Cytophagia bacterium]|nr:MAG: DUF1684 domain-containing protein [Cytophagales bacterium]TAG39667.1 MAG: DUF1684 domain-containing protein [Cytophagia bacterium]TAG69267.1 MAG: DUF1684 domain-containing protein [Runella slithyformis]TAG84807.1 MAG: DUF1684 domain-containing protein [Cytophagales bacterium]